MAALFSTSKGVQAAHIQNMSEAASLKTHWGYPSRVVPCSNDPGSCEYLDSVYGGHDISMLYSFILWAVIGGILFIWGIGRHFMPSRRPPTIASKDDAESPARPQSFLYRLSRSSKALIRRYLLPESLTSIFGRTTRIQVLILIILSGYLIIFTFVGIVYKKWVTPVKGLPGVYNTRTGLGPWSDRIGVLAFALTPLSVLLSSRESLLSLITGIPYQNFNFLHRWLGYIILLQSALHTLGWTIVEARLYQPQPSVWNSFISQLYMIWGVIAMIFLSFLFVFSTQWAIRLTGYEFFRKSHYVVAMLYIGACWGHWSKLACWMIASLVVWLLDRGIRLVRTALLHYNYLRGTTSAMQFSSTVASISLFQDDANGDVIRLDFEQGHDAWHVGQHFYLCFPQLSIWQAHPFSPTSLPSTRGEHQRHSYVLRAKAGETRKLAQLIRQKGNMVPKEASSGLQATTSVILAGPYGSSVVDDRNVAADTNILCIAGGTGITFVLPVMLGLASQPTTLSENRKIELIWVIRKKHDMRWIANELKTLRSASAITNLKIHIFVTGEDEVDAKDGGGSGVVDTVSKTPRDVCEKAYGVGEDDDLHLASPSSSEDGKNNGSSALPLISVQRLLRPSQGTTEPETSKHPDLPALVRDFVANTVCGPTRIVTSGPRGMISDLRVSVASCNSATRVWKGDEKFDVELVDDDRLER
jgi:NAD(P)H-flavin reductase